MMGSGQCCLHKFSVALGERRYGSIKDGDLYISGLMTHKAQCAVT